jgi:hypothetical protein
MEKNKKNPPKLETLDEDYYYRDQEMMRTKVESDVKEKDEEKE